MDGVLLIALGVGLLLTARSYLLVVLDVEPKLMRLNFPRLSRRFPRATGGVASFAVWSTVVFGCLLGAAAIVAGVVLLV